MNLVFDIPEIVLHLHTHQDPFFAHIDFFPKALPYGYWFVFAAKLSSGKSGWKVSQHFDQHFLNFCCRRCRPLWPAGLPRLKVQLQALKGETNIYICIYVHTCLYLYICRFTYIYIYIIFPCIELYTSVLYIYLYICVNIYIYVHLFRYMHIYVYIYMYMYFD